MKFKVISEEEKTCQVALYALDSDAEGTVIIPSIANGYTVVEIGDNSFSYPYKKITSVSIPQSVERIGSSAFAGCTSLQSFSFSDSTYVICPGAFYGTKWYDNQPNGMVYAGKVLYSYKGELPQNTSLTVRAGTLGIANGVFLGLSDLKAINIANSVKHIGNGAFEDCKNLVSVNLPESLVSLGEYAFYGCKNIKAITIPDLLTTIKDYTFGSCTNLSEVTIGKGLKSISFGPWQYGTDAFAGCENIKKLTVNCQKLDILPSSLKNNLEELVIGDNTEDIGYYSFYSNNSKLKKVSIGKNVKSVGGFTGCASLETVILSEGNESIDNEAFTGCDKLSHIYLPSTIKEIGPVAFSGCAFEEFSIPESVTSIGYGAFSGCHNLASINIPHNVTAIPDHFLSSTGLTTFEIPDYVTSIGMGAFGGCSKLESIKASENLTSIGRDAFMDVPWYNNQEDGLFYLGSVACGYHGIMPEKTVIRLKDSTRGVAACAFFDQANLTSIMFPDGMENIGDAAFQNCTGLTSIVIPEKLDNMGCEVFSGCTNLKRIDFHTTPSSCYNFIYCKNIEAIYAYMEKPREIWDLFGNDDDEEASQQYVYDNAILYVPAEYRASYEKAWGWSRFKNIQDIPNSNNRLYMEPAEVQLVNGYFELPIRLKNNVDVAGASFTLALPDGMTLAKDADGDLFYKLNGERAKETKFSVYSAENTNGSYGVRILPTGTSTISGTDGTLMTFTVNVDEAVEGGEYPILLTENSLTVKDAEGTLSTMELEDTRTTMTIIDVMPGDVNKDYRVDLTDAIMIVYASLGVAQPGFIGKAADVNSDGRVDLTDAIIVVYKSLDVEQSREVSMAEARRMLAEAVDKDCLVISDVIIPRGGTVELPVGFAFSSGNTNVGFQLSLNLPEGVTAVKDEDGTPVYTKDAASCGKMTIYPTATDGFAALPQTANASIKGTEGTLFTITLQADESVAPGTELTATVTNAMLTMKDADGKMHTVAIDDFSFAIAVGQLCDFTQGWNWMSTNIASEELRDSRVFLAGFKDKMLRLVGQTDELVNDPVYGLVGDLATLNVTAGYKLKVSENVILAVASRTVDASTPVSLAKGWNWIGYLPSMAQTVSTALENYEATAGDRIISQDDGFAEYDGTAWVPSDFMMWPCKGYMYKSGKDATLVYSSRTTDGEIIPASRLADRQARTENGALSYDAHKYPDVLTMVAKLEPSVAEARELSTHTVAAFCGDECRGVGRWADGRLFLTVHGEMGQGSTITLRLYDTVTEEAQDIEETFVFEGQCLGTLAEPVLLHPIDIATKTVSIPMDGKESQRIYSPDGKQLEKPLRGLNIVVTQDGTARKIMR